MTTMGWECPRCHRCYAPSITQCPNCGGMGGTPAVPSPYWPSQPYIVTWGSGTVTTEPNTYITINSTLPKENNA